MKYIILLITVTMFVGLTILHAMDVPICFPHSYWMVPHNIVMDMNDVMQCVK